MNIGQICRTSIIRIILIESTTCLIIGNRLFKAIVISGCATARGSDRLAIDTYLFIGVDGFAAGICIILIARQQAPGIGPVILCIQCNRIAICCSIPVKLNHNISLQTITVILIKKALAYRSIGDVNAVGKSHRGNRIAAAGFNILGMKVDTTAGILPVSTLVFYLIFLNVIFDLSAVLIVTRQVNRSRHSATCKIRNLKVFDQRIFNCLSMSLAICISRNPESNIFRQSLQINKLFHIGLAYRSLWSSFLLPILFDTDCRRF